MPRRARPCPTSSTVQIDRLGDFVAAVRRTGQTPWRSTRQLRQRLGPRLFNPASTLDQLGHDLAQPLGTHRCRDVHRMYNIGEQHRHLLVLRRSSGVCDWRAALATELGCAAYLSAARPAGHSGRRQRTATVLNAVHVSIVSPLLRDVRHIAVPSPIRSFESDPHMSSCFVTR